MSKQSHVIKVDFPLFGTMMESVKPNGQFFAANDRVKPQQLLNQTGVQGNLGGYVFFSFGLRSVIYN